MEKDVISLGGEAAGRGGGGGGEGLKLPGPLSPCDLGPVLALTLREKE